MKRKNKTFSVYIQFIELVWQASVQYTFDDVKRMLSVANFIINWPLNNLNINRHRINRRIGLRDDFNLVVRPLIDFRASNRNKKLQKV